MLEEVVVGVIREEASDLSALVAHHVERVSGKGLLQQESQERDYKKIKILLPGQRDQERDHPSVQLP